MKTWAKQELAHADLGDARLNKRLGRIVEDLAAQPEASVPQASGDWAATKGAYNFWKSSRVESEAIREAHYQSTIGRAHTHSTILAIQDTTDLNFSRHPATTGLGLLSSQPYLKGLKVHSVLIVSPDGVPLGLLDQQVWAREPQPQLKAKQRRQRPLKEKESLRWLKGVVATELDLPEETTIVTVADREADIYDLFALERSENSHLLIRGTQNRRVDHELKYLNEVISQVKPCGELVVCVPRCDDRPARESTLTVRYSPVTIQSPRNRLRRSALKTVNLQVVLAREENPPDGIDPIEWLLLTTLAVGCFEDAVQCIRWYCYRWLIERYHFVLKSGCRVEELQLSAADRIERALATYCIVAWRLLWLTYEARMNPDAPCDMVLETHEWQALYCTIHNTPIPTAKPPSLRQAVRWIAQLGGFLARKHDGEPGVKTIWRGFRRLHDIAATWELSRSQPLTGKHSRSYG
jgi:Transposase DNA-binding/Transposase Tn5 dimerisation domain